jgi:hypothetical protein
VATEPFGGAFCEIASLVTTNAPFQKVGIAEGKMRKQEMISPQETHCTLFGLSL